MSIMDSIEEKYEDEIAKLKTACLEALTKDFMEQREQIATKDKMITTFMGVMDHDQEDAEYLHEQIAAREQSLEIANNTISLMAKQIAALMGENTQLKKNSEWQATEIETLRKRVILTPAESCLTFSEQALRGEDEK